MKKTLITLMLTSVISSNAVAESRTCSEGYQDFEHLNGCLGRVVDSGISILADLPSNAKEWSDKQHEKAKQKIENIKNDICNSAVSDPIPAKEIIVEKIVEKPVEKIVEKIVYVDRTVEVEVEVEVPAKTLERRCVTQKQHDRFGNTKERTTCTEWK